MNHRGARGFIVVAVGTVALGTAVLAQQARPTFRSSADLVRLHVIVQDEQGRPVRGLTKDDFALLDSSKPRAIDIFEEVSRPAGPGVQPLLPATFPLDVADNQTTRVSRLVVILFDDMVIRPYLEKSKDLARELVRRFGDDALLALLMTSGMDGVEATMDRAAILRAIERVGTPASKAPRIPQKFGNFTSQPTVGELFRVPSDSSIRSRPPKGCHLEALEQAAWRAAGPETLRRAFVYITPFCGVDFFDEELPLDPYWQYRETIEAFRRADVTLYALDPRGELGFSFDQFPTGDITGSEPVTMGWRTKSASPVFNSQEGLKELTEATGGFAVTNSNAFEQGLNRLSRDLSDYYVLAFYADDPKPDRYHPIDVKVNRPGISVRARPGYVSGTAPAKLEDKDPMVRLTAGALPVPDLPLRLFAVSEPRGARNSRLTLVIDVGWTGIEQPQDGRIWRESLDATVVLAKVLSGTVERTWALKREVMVPVPADRAPGTVAYQMQTDVDVPPGSYQIRVSAKSATTGKAGSVYLAIDVPKAGAAPLSLGEIVVGAIDGVPSAVAPSPTGMAPLPFAVTLNRAFDAAERIRLFARITRRAAPAPPRATMQLIDATNRVVRTLDAAITPGDRAIDTTIPLAGLAPGAYRARLAVTDGTSSASREISFVVRP